MNNEQQQIENEVSADQVAITRKTAAQVQSKILQRLAEVTQTYAAKCMGVDPSKVSRMKEDLEDFCKLLVALDMRIYASDCLVVTRDEYNAYKSLAYKLMEMERRGGRKCSACGHVHTLD